MKIYSYVIDHDLGFAPNPFFGYCTLACCKPQIRARAERGDFVLGTGSKSIGLQGRLCYWMQVEDTMSFDEYWADPRFQVKKPNRLGSRYQQVGDNIYHRDAPDKPYQQSPSVHSQADGTLHEAHHKRDTATTDRVLISRTYVYWGANGIAIPAHLAGFIHDRPAHLCRFDDEAKSAMLSWLSTLPGHRLSGQPAAWAKLDAQKPARLSKGRTHRLETGRGTSASR